MTLLNDIQIWTAACRYDYLIPNRGVGVLLPDGAQAALFRLDDGSLHAVGNVDPFSGAAVMSRGIVGDRGGRASASTAPTSRCRSTPPASWMDMSKSALKRRHAETVFQQARTRAFSAGIQFRGRS